MISVARIRDLKNRIVMHDSLRQQKAYDVNMSNYVNMACSIEVQ
jgi:post-segregation antitoxin (ccd killing protein)